jgi:hypothetical protein
MINAGRSLQTPTSDAERHNTHYDTVEAPALQCPVVVAVAAAELLLKAE